MAQPALRVDQPAISFTMPEFVVVSGAASGFGALASARLLERDVQVVGVDLSPPTEANERHPGYTHVNGDVTDAETWDDVRNALPPVGVSGGLVTCAAILHVGTVVDHPLEAWRKVIDVNVTGTFLALKAIVPELLARDGGPVVCLGSIDALFAEQQLASYCASKAAVYQLARTTALDFARQGIRINVLSPGPMRVGLFERHLEAVGDPSLLDVRTARQPIGRIMDPEEVARAAMFLLSDGATGMTGTEVLVDGGLTAGYEFRPC